MWSRPSPPNELCIRFVSWEAGPGPSQQHTVGTLPGHDSISNSPAVVLLGKKRGRTHSAKKAAVHKGTTAAQEFSIVPTISERSSVIVTPTTPPHTPKAPRQPPAHWFSLSPWLSPSPKQTEPFVSHRPVGTEPQPLMEKDKATGSHYLIHFSLNQMPSALLPQMTPTNFKTRNKTMREGASRKLGYRYRNKDGHPSIQPLDSSAIPRTIPQQGSTNQTLPLCKQNKAEATKL